jgi:hypothetical protein
VNPRSDPAAAAAIEQGRAAAREAYRLGMHILEARKKVGLTQNELTERELAPVTRHRSPGMRVASVATMSSASNPGTSSTGIRSVSTTWRTSRIC